jgi:hypothetical protein
VSPAVYPEAVTDPEKPNTPAVDSDQNVIFVAVCDPAIDVHEIAAELACDPADAVPNVAICFRDVSVAVFAVPAAPGAPTASWAHG